MVDSNGKITLGTVYRLSSNGTYKLSDGYSINPDGKVYLDGVLTFEPEFKS
jgi:hypothetical protein